MVEMILRYLQTAVCLLSLLTVANALKRDDNIWLDTWTSMPQLCEPGNLPPVPYNGTGIVFQNSTIRQTIHASLGGSQIRIRISNAFGVTDLSITAATVALPMYGSAGVSAIISSTLSAMTFSGSPNYIISPGAHIISDPINLPISAQSMLTLSIYLQDGQTSAKNAITCHPGSRTTSWLSPGDATASSNLIAPGTISTAHWYFISAVEVNTSKDNTALVIIGDSITDGRGSDTDQNNRWPDLLLARLQNTTDLKHIAILNQAAGGNRILADGLGPSAFSRIDRDVLAHAHVGYMLLFEGVNDIGGALDDANTQKLIGDRLIAAFSQITLQMREFGILVFGGTIMPFSAPRYNTSAQVFSSEERERTRQRVNRWIRESGNYDAVIDFDSFLRVAENGSTLDPGVQSGDWLHPNGTGYERIAAQFPLDIFSKKAS